MEEHKKYLELTSDVVFKEFMMSENTREFKADLIHAITKIPVEDLLKAEYSSKELVGEHKEDKVFRTDIIVNVEKKNLLVIEMNKEYYDGIMQKTHAYGSRVISEELERGHDYIEVKEVIEISFNDFNVMDHNRLINELAITNISTGKIVKEMMWRGYQIDLKTITDKCYNQSEEEIIDLFKMFSGNVEIIDSLKGKNKSMDKAINELNKISNDERIIGLYDVEAVERKVYNSKMMTAERIGMEKGMKEGLEKGIEKGIEKGMEKGMEKGVEIVALNMLKNNFNIKDVVNCTGLSKEEVNKLKATLN